MKAIIDSKEHHSGGNESSSANNNHMTCSIQEIKGSPVATFGFMTQSAPWLSRLSKSVLLAIHDSVDDCRRVRYQHSPCWCNWVGLCWVAVWFDMAVCEVIRQKVVCYHNEVRWHGLSLGKPLQVLFVKPKRFGLSTWMLSSTISTSVCVKLQEYQCAEVLNLKTKQINCENRKNNFSAQHVCTTSFPHLQHCRSQSPAWKTVAVWA